MSRYQGLVALEGGNLEDAAHEYFPAFGADPDPRAARGRRGMAPAAMKGRSIAGAPAACCCNSCPRRQSGRGRPIFIPAMRRKAPVTHAVAEDDAWVEGQSLIGNRRGRRTDRSGSVGRAAALSPVPRARRARVRAASLARAMLLLARRGLRDAAKLCRKETAPRWSRTARWW